MDTLSKLARSERMSRVRNKNTKPELLVRRLVWGLGFRYRLHARTLPGHPDMVFPQLRRAVFMHGCFWHRHPGCRNCRLPKSRLDFWRPKLRANRFRDLRNQRALEKLGWSYLVVWECELHDRETVARKLTRFLKRRTA